MSKRIPTDEMFQHWNAAYKEAEQPWREGYDRKKVYGILGICQGLTNAIRREAKEWKPTND